MILEAILLQECQSQLRCFPVPILENNDGTLGVNLIKKSIFPENLHFSTVKVLAIENTNEFSIGKALPLSYPVELSKICKEKNVKLVLNGSRLLNAYYYHKILNPELKVSDLTKDYDSVSISLAKGLRCPFGSVLAGSEEFIAKALRWLKVLGGGIRQVGYFAAAALDSLSSAEETFTNAHKNAKILYKSLQSLGFNCEEPQTNIIVFANSTNKPNSELVNFLNNHQILVTERLDQKIQIVTHSEVQTEDVQYAADVFSRFLINNQ